MEPKIRRQPEWNQKGKKPELKKGTAKGLDLALEKHTRSSISGADDGVVTTALQTLVSS